MSVVTRFAPSPTGYLHIGSARTALFNYLFAKANGGKFLLRIEDTDQTRSTKGATDAIFSGLRWLGLDWDGEYILQSSRINRHVQIAFEMLNSGKAYYCFATQEEIEAQRLDALNKKEYFIFKSKWRDCDPKDYPKDKKPVIRLKALRDGQTVIRDKLQGDVMVPNDHLDDMVLLRSDGTPTYMLAVVVDDIDMGITHIIRGDDHLTNAARQMQIYHAMNWRVPIFVHIPLIHGQDGAKLSKRHGALGVEAYRDLGYLPEALCNYLLRLGWSHGNDEIIPRNLAIEWFNLNNLGKAPARLDFDKMKHVNAHYLRKKSNQELIDILEVYIELSNDDKFRLLKVMDSIKPRVELITDLVNLSKIYLPSYEIKHSEELLREAKNDINQKLLADVINVITNLPELSNDIVKIELSKLAEVEGIKIGKLMHPLRILITGSTSSPSVFEIIATIGKDATIKRLLL
jgi:glutamyl-tRNA synthetase